MEVVTRPGAPLTALFERALDGLGNEPDPADVPVFTAALGVLARRGTRAATMDDIATASGVGRATLFRRYGSKDRLFERALRFALHSLLTEVGRIFVATTDPVERIAETFAACMRSCSMLVPSDAAPHHAADMLEVLTQGDPSMLDIGHRFVAGHIADSQAEGRIPSGDPDMKADALIRITLGYLVTPNRRFDLSDPGTVRTIARTVIAPIVGTDQP